MIFSSRLKEMRKQNNLTMLQLADKLGVGKSTIAGYEGAERRPSQDRLKELALIFNTSTDYLLGITDDPTPRNNDSTDLMQILKSDHFHIEGRKLSEEDKDLLLSILERISKEEKEVNGHQK